MRGPGDYTLKPARIGAAEPNKVFMHDWWNGRHVALRTQCAQAREGSSPLLCTWRISNGAHARDGDKHRALREGIHGEYTIPRFMPVSPNWI